MKTYLEFQDAGQTRSGKTGIWFVIAISNRTQLGTIAWHAPWRKYVFGATNDAIFDPSCLGEIIAFLGEIQKGHECR